MNVLIAVPAYRNEIKAPCTSSVVGAFQLFADLKIPAFMRAIGAADIVMVRNLFAAIMLAEDYTHLLFIDNDMDFRPAAIRRMIDAQTPLIGVVATRRGLDMQRFHAAARTMTLQQSLSAAMQFNVMAKEPQITLQSGIASVARIGCAIALIERRVFSELALHPAIRREQTAHQGRGDFEGKLYGFFDQTVTPEGDLLSEDYSFCDRWRILCGGEVRAIFDEDVGHHGDFRYSAKFPGVP